ncbi:imidazolonepropionase [compost metagenome]
MVSTIVVCGLLIDGNGDEPLRNRAISINDGMIEWVKPAETLGPEVENVIDLSHLTVLPGLIDCHDHLGVDLGDEEAQCREPIEYISIRCVKNAKDILRAGITTMRSVGEKDRTGPMMKRAIQEGLVQGPRLVVAGRNIVRTGGHAHFLGLEADGPDELRAAVREEIKNGADLIKIMVSGGLSTLGSDVLAAEFAEDEIKAVIEEAHRRGRKVAGHCHGGPGTTVAVKAGIDSIEHGIYLTEDEIQLMVEHGTYLVVTAGVILAIRDQPDVPAFMKEKLKDDTEIMFRTIASTKGTGLKIAVGTDEIHGELYKEMEYLTKAGYTPMEALLAGTKNGADLCGMADRLGTLEAGKYADLIAVEGNPLEDFSILKEVSFVMKAGVIEFDTRHHMAKSR